MKPLDPRDVPLDDETVSLLFPETNIGWECHYCRLAYSNPARHLEFYPLCGEDRPRLWSAPESTPEMNRVKHPTRAEALDKLAEGFNLPRHLLEVDDYSDATLRAQAAIDNIVTQTVRNALAAEEAVAIAALRLGYGYAVIEERSDTIADFEQNSYKITITDHFLISPWIPKMNRYVFPSWDAYNEWRDRQ